MQERPEQTTVEECPVSTVCPLLMMLVMGSKFLAAGPRA